MATSTKVSLKLLIDKKANKVLFAEAGKDFVDFLFNLLSLPVGTVIRLLTKQGMVGCLGHLYESVENLSETYIQPNQNKDSLLNPKAPTVISLFPLLLQGNTSTPASQYYRCPNNYHITDTGGIQCPCGYQMSAAISYFAPAGIKASSTSEGGYVKGVVTYMVMDDLTVSPMSTISSITLLNKFNIKDVGALEEKVVHLGMEEGLKLLEASLHSKVALTYVFLGVKLP